MLNIMATQQFLNICSCLLQLQTMVDMFFLFFLNLKGNITSLRGGAMSKTSPVPNAIVKWERGFKKKFFIRPTIFYTVFQLYSFWLQFTPILQEHFSPTKCLRHLFLNLACHCSRLVEAPGVVSEYRVQTITNFTQAREKRTDNQTFLRHSKFYHLVI